MQTAAIVQLGMEARDLALMLTPVRTKTVVRRAKASVEKAYSQSAIWEILRALAAALFGDIDVRIGVERGDMIELDIGLPGQTTKTLEKGKGLIGRVIKRKRPHYVSCLQEDDPNWAKEPGTQFKSIYTVPVFCDETRIPGAVQVRCVRVNAFPHRGTRRAFHEFVAWAGERAVQAELKRACLNAMVRPSQPKDDWRLDLLDVFVGGEADLTSLLKAKWQVAKRFAGELFRIGGSTCTASSVRIYNAQSEELFYVVCHGPAWTPTARAKAYHLKRSRSAGRLALSQKEAVWYPTVAGREFDAVMPETQSLWAKRYSVNGVVRGVVSVDWGVQDGASEDTRRSLERMVAQFEVILTSVAAREEQLYGRLQQSVRDRDKDGLRSVLREVAEIFQAGHCALYLDQHHTDTLTLEAATHEVTAPEILKQSYAFGKGVTGWVAQHRKPIFVKDPNDPAELETAADRHGIKTAPVHTAYETATEVSGVLAAPMVARNRVVGVIRLGDLEKTEFSSEAEAFLQDIANRLAQELDRVWIESEAKDRLAHVELLRLDIRDAVRGAIVEVSAGAHADGGFVEFRDGQLELNLVETTGLLQSVPSPEKSLGGMEPGFDSNIYARPEWAVLGSALKSTYGTSVSEVFQSAAIFPVDLPKLDDVSVRIGLLHRVPPKWMRSADSARDQVVKGFSNRMAVAILPALHLARSERRVKNELRAFQSLLRAATCAATIDEVAQAFLESALQETGMELGVVRLYDHGNWLRVAPSDRLEYFPDVLPTQESFQRCMASKEPLLHTNVQDWKEWKADCTRGDGARRDFLLNVRSVVMIPLWNGVEFIGVISLQSVSREVQIPEGGKLHLALLAPIAASALKVAALQQKRLDLAEPFAMIGVFLGSYLHHSRNGITAAQGYCDNLRRLRGLPPAAVERLEKLDQALAAASAVTRDLAAVKLDDQAAPESLSLNDLVDEAWSNLARTMDVSKHIPKRLLDPSNPRISGNRVQIETAIRMLLQNAIEATQDTSQRIIRFQTAIRNGRAILKVADSGCGMDEMTIRRAFRPFFTTKPTGSGLGLAIVKWVARGHDAQVRWTSSPGWGTSIAIRFPLEAQGNG